MNHRIFTRRNLVRGAGAAGLALPFGAAFGPRQSSAQQGQAPKRLLVIEMPNVVWQPDWLPTGGRHVTLGTGDATQFELGPQSAMFESVKQHITIIEGVPLERAIGDAHVGAQIHFMSGGVMGQVDKNIDPVPNAPPPTPIPQGSELSRFPSIDQILARDTALGLGGATRSVTWSANTDHSGERPHAPILSFDTAPTPQPIFPDNNPLRAYNSLFSGFMPGELSAEQQAQLEVALRQKRSLLDYTLDSVNRLSARVSAEEKQRLEGHIQGLRELEGRLSAAMAGSGYAQVTLPNPATLDGLALNDALGHQKVLEGFLGLTKASFGFDRTRVATLMLAAGHHWVNFKALLPDMIRSGATHSVTHTNYANKNLDMRRISSWYGNILGPFVQDLASTPDADGSSMLDNTLIVFFGEVSITGDGVAAQHSYKNTPLVMLGGKNIGNVGGRCLRYTGRNTMDFWTSVGRQLGLAEDFVQGEPDFSSGGLPELFATA